MASETLEHTRKTRLALVRDEIGLSQAKMAERTGIPIHKIRYAETADEKISREIAGAVSEIFGYSQLWLLTGEGPKRLDRPTANDHEADYRVTEVIHPGPARIDKEMLLGIWRGLKKGFEKGGVTLSAEELLALAIEGYNEAQEEVANTAGEERSQRAG